MEEKRALFALSRVPMIGPRRFLALVTYFGSGREVWRASRKDVLKSRIVGPSIFEGMTSLRWTDIDDMIRRIHDKNQEWTTYFDDDYPQRLRGLPDPPVILYHLGGIRTLFNEKCIAVVGTRKATQYGLDRVEDIIKNLADMNPHIISGLAYGIDKSAHLAALKYHIPTSAIVANGLDCIYPARHRGLASEIARAGCVLCEYPPGVKAEREFFPMRNRIVAGLSDLTIVVESDIRGGSMITAWMANEYQREVATFPGGVGQKYSRGPHHLIKNHQAHLIEDASDVVALMGWEKGKCGQRQLDLFDGLEMDQRRIIHALSENPGLHIDVLMSKLKMPAGELAMYLLQLEMSDRIRALPGKRYVLHS